MGLSAAWLAVSRGWVPPCASVVRVLGSVDSGALKVCWVTFQIIMSTTWTLDVSGARRFRNDAID